jgi:hypothetical protein
LAHVQYIDDPAGRSDKKDIGVLGMKAGLTL